MCVFPVMMRTPVLFFCSSIHYIKGEFIQQGLFLKKKRTKGLADWKNIL
ncbi:hypothetical protein BPUM_2999 [Bacillus pumilus SAFR-032]|uniref:Uncharacterized protein n=1 Tax=Bacillus pumilus (strain SAFR-032) TaxID=315750 RepID=A8FHD6_BACP2|nr:hypothetical protein BPUM_2999 [Bacillus pumilus SAFR-032]